VRPAEAVRHDASSLYKFIDCVVLPCAVKTHFSYTAPAQEFFDFISKLGVATKSHVAGLCKELNDDFALANLKAFSLRAQELATLRFSWFELHKYVKPAAEAHTLESPVSLVAALTERLRTLEGFENVRFAVIHTSNLNYFQLQSNHFRTLARQVSAIVDGAPPFPEDLAIVGLPYSQSKNLFLNTLLGHEMGHFSFEKRNEGVSFSNALKTLISKNATKQEIEHFKPQDIARCLGLARDWLEEIYCDLFALRLIGPAFSYAFIELFALTRRKAAKEFSSFHPALTLRLREQTRMLRASTTSWWPAMTTPPSHYTDLMADAAGLDNAYFSYKDGTPGSVEELAMKYFFDVLDEPIKAINSLFGEPNDQIEPFISQRNTIENYLSFGVVPSRIIVHGRVVNPTATTLLNASYGFNLTKLDVLLDRLSGVDNDCIACRSYWAERVEMWTSKALEDVTTNGYTIKVSY